MLRAVLVVLGEAAVVAGSAVFLHEVVHKSWAVSIVFPVVVAVAVLVVLLRRGRRAGAVRG